MWSRDLELDVDVTAGSVTIHVPADVGIELETRRLLGSVETRGLNRSGDRFVSPNLATARRKVRIRASATLARVELIHDR
jgi:predicted membrane protein